MGLQRHAGAAIVVLMVSLSVSMATECPALLEEFYKFSNRQPSAYSPESMLYVLHTPPAVSSAFERCLLRPGTVGLRRCPAFGGAEQIPQETIDLVPQDCLWSSYDDLSVLQQVNGKVAVATLLQDPQERFVDAYELAVELAAQKIAEASQPPKSPYEQYFRRSHPMDFWPWTALGTFIKKDTTNKWHDLEEQEATAPERWIELETRREGKRYFLNTVTEEEKEELTAEEQALLLPPVDPYNNELVLPLKEFVSNPRVVKALHNGALMQVLGLTNISRWDKAQELRKCIRKDQAVADSLLAFAKKRVESFAHVGIAEEPGASAEVAASLLGLQLDQPAFIPGERYVQGLKKVKTLSWKGGMKPQEMQGKPKEVTAPPHTAKTIEELRVLVEAKEKEAQELYDVGYKMYMDGGKKHDNAKLMELRSQLSELKTAAMQWKIDLEEWDNMANLTKTTDTTLSQGYHMCVATMQEELQNRTKKNLGILSMPDGRAVRFTAAARKSIPSEVLAEIRRVNALDVELYEYAKQLLLQRRDALKAAGKLQTLQEPVQALTSSIDQTAAQPDHKTEEL